MDEKEFREELLKMYGYCCPNKKYSYESFLEDVLYCKGVDTFNYEGYILPA